MTERSPGHHGGHEIAEWWDAHPDAVRLGLILIVLAVLVLLVLPQLGFDLFGIFS